MDGCVSRALLKHDYLNLIQKAGFKSVEELEYQIIRPQNKPIKIEAGMRKRKLKVGENTYNVTLTEEEDELLCESILKSHIKGTKPL
ncbi:MAG: hypothetical protein HeimC3_10240 [Candidatus Heimdallarchaeota archaeon LC_3]|nr:MAG: hypothetical protein HeimC3_10240 [Candidatus Heimdallarchaeota archaeon LC_3]